MAIRLGDYVLYGELRNKNHYSTTMRVALRHAEEDDDYCPLIVELTGDCADDIKGKFIRFYPHDQDAPGPVFSRQDHPRFQDRQIGPTGLITAAGWVRMLPCDPIEFVKRAELGEPPPTTWARRLYIEWYGQNGRVVIEMGDAIVEECVREPEGDEDDGDWAPLPNLEPMPTEERPKSYGPEIVMVTQDEDEINTYHFRPMIDDEDDEEDDLPQELKDALKEERLLVDMTIAGIDPDSPVADLELIDHCIDNVEGVSLNSMLGNITYPTSEGMDDEEVEGQLKALLTHLAMLGVALSVCEHYTPRDAYDLLVKEILPDSNAFGELVGTGWVTHYSTHEYCEECEAQAEKDFQEYERQRKERGEDDAFDDDDIPF